jgi:hypothetical protein
MGLARCQVAGGEGEGICFGPQEKLPEWGSLARLTLALSLVLVLVLVRFRVVGEHSRHSLFPFIPPPS